MCGTELNTTDDVGTIEMSFEGGVMTREAICPPCVIIRADERKYIKMSVEFRDHDGGLYILRAKTTPDKREKAAKMLRVKMIDFLSKLNIGDEPDRPESE